MASILKRGAVPKKLTVGDVFIVECKHGVKCFQYIGTDETQMSSDVIVAFSPIFSRDSLPDLSAIVSSEVDFYAHCIIKLGIKLSTWMKVGNTEVCVGVEAIRFRDSSDYGNKQVSTSLNWWVWNVNKPQVFVGPLRGADTDAAIGLVFSPPSIVHRMCLGAFNLPAYPSY